MIYFNRGEKTESVVTIEYQGKLFTGNNKNILLEQLEQQKFQIPYSCRAGICGHCVLTLLEGEVIPMTSHSKKIFPWILSCSCIPQSSPLRLK